MAIYLSAYSSLSYLERREAPRTPALVGSLESSECTVRAVMSHEPALRSIGCWTAPLHLLVDNRNKTSSSDWIVCHRWAQTLPPGSFFSPCRDVFVSTPEFCFLQLAGALPRISLIRLGYEMCATYRLDSRSEHGFCDCAPLTTPARLELFLSRSASSRATEKAQDALRWVTARSASPRETALAMLLSLPTEMGGCGAGLPELNYELEVSREGMPEKRRIDLFWSDARFGLEYDSDQEHASPESLAKDSLREKEIELEGIRLARVTNGELRSEQGRELLFRTVCHALGKRRVAPSERTRFARRELAIALLSPHRSMLPEPLLV